MTRIGMLGAKTPIEVASDGAIRLGGSKGTLRVWIGAEDGWHDPAEQAATRQHRMGAAPIIETRTRVAGGDVSVFAYGAYTHPDTYVADIVNQTSAACVVALVVEHMPTKITGTGRQDFGRPHLIVDRVPRDFIGESDRKALWNTVTRLRAASIGDAGVSTNDLFSADSGEEFPASYALVYPLAHGASLRVAMQATPGDVPPMPALPDPATVEAGWAAQMKRGLQCAIPDPKMQQAIDAARIDLLLAHATAAATPDVMIALEDWGFDPEAAAAFAQLGFLDRRRVVHRPVDAAPWNQLQTAMRELSPVFGFAHGPAAFLNHMRSLLAFERPDGTVDLLTYYPSAWAGQSIDVQHAPTRGGWVSYSVRWHGNRPALLWECEKPGLRMHVPGLDPLWMTEEQQGEALLAPFAV